MSNPKKLAPEARHVRDPMNAEVEVGGLKITRHHLTLIAGPCAAETEEQVRIAARAAKEAGTDILRGGAFKPRTSPYAFQGLGETGLRMLRCAADENGLKLVTEVMCVGQIGLVSRYADILQVGSRNMQNFELLKALADQGKPVLLKRGLSATIEEWLYAAEYILAGLGGAKVILCERGIRTFESSTRNTLDLSAVAVVHDQSALPIIVDPSHAAGERRYVGCLTLAAVAVGADGIMVDIHHDPTEALCDGPQALLPTDLRALFECARSAREMSEQHLLVQ